MIQCPNPIVLQEWLEDSLETAERMVLNEHLKECRECRQTINRLKILDWDLSHQAVPMADPRQFDEIRKQALRQIAPTAEQAEEGRSGKGLWSLTVGNMKYAVYYTAFNPIARWLPDRLSAKSAAKFPSFHLVTRRGTV